IRELAPAEAPEHARLAAAGFEAPAEPFLELMTPSVLAAPGVRCYLGEVDGEPVTTAVGLTLGSCVGIFNVATPPAYSRRGEGAEVMFLDAAPSGQLTRSASFGWLNASAKADNPAYFDLNFAGLREYDRLVADFRGATWWNPTGHLRWDFDDDQQLAASVEQL